jgi:hypothetical protein
MFALPARLSAVVFTLSLTIWLFFYYTTEPPLSGHDTTFVVGVVAAAVSGARWFWSRVAGTWSQS